MALIRNIHWILGEMVLPLLIVATAIYLTVTWKPNAPRSIVARIFPVLVDIQVTLGIILFIYLAVNIGGYYLSFPFLLHPILGLLAAALAHLAVGKRNPLAALGRWAPLASLATLLIIVLSGVVVATQNVGA